MTNIQTRLERIEDALEHAYRCADAEADINGTVSHETQSAIIMLKAEWDRIYAHLDI